jgi:hypothetical protein
VPMAMNSGLKLSAPTLEIYLRNQSAMI